MSLIDIQKLAAEPYYGAFYSLRSLDPLYQSEIGEPRWWEADLEKECGCSCRHCEPEWKRVKFEAVTAEDAWEIAIAQCSGELCGYYPVGLRVAGAGCKMWEGPQ